MEGQRDRGGGGGGGEEEERSESFRAPSSHKCVFSYHQFFPPPPPLPPSLPSYSSSVGFERFALVHAAHFVNLESPIVICMPYPTAQVKWMMHSRHKRSAVIVIVCHVFFFRRGIRHLQCPRIGGGDKKNCWLSFSFRPKTRNAHHHYVYNLCFFAAPPPRIVSPW